MNKLIICLLTFSSSLVYSHARLLSPTPRNNASGIKNGPCGGLARSANPMVVMGGTMLTVNWQETINHPGRYILSLSMANDAGFEQNVLATVVDNQDNNVLPHMYTTQVAIPNINCPTCTLQLIQSMEENPAAPSYYYSCADLNIQQQVATPPPAPTPTPTPGGGESTQSSTLNQAQSGVKFGQGCGSVKAVAIEGPSQMWHALFVFLMMLIPGISWALLRRQRSATI